MSILRDHFERVAQFKERGLPITAGVFVDVGGTLIGRTLNQPLVDFLQWNNTHKLLGDNHVFSSDLLHAQELIDQEKFDIRTIGVGTVIPKHATYNTAFSLQHGYNLGLTGTLTAEEKAQFVGQPAHALELVIDDSPLGKAGIKGAAIVVTTWHPRDEEVRAFLAQKDYLAHTP